jgi:hypothetical protein
MVMVPSQKQGVATLSDSVVVHPFTEGPGRKELRAGVPMGDPDKNWAWRRAGAGFMSPPGLMDIGVSEGKGVSELEELG